MILISVVPRYVHYCVLIAKALKTPYLDLYLMHAPYGFYEDSGDLFPVDENQMIRQSDVDFLDTWREMEKLVEKGLFSNMSVSCLNDGVPNHDLIFKRFGKKLGNFQLQCGPNSEDSRKL